MTAIDTRGSASSAELPPLPCRKCGTAAVPLMPWKALALAAPHSFTQGDAQVTVVSDGHIMLPLYMIATDASPEQLAESPSGSDTRRTVPVCP